MTIEEILAEAKKMGGGVRVFSLNGGISTHQAQEIIGSELAKVKGKGYTVEGAPNNSIRVYKHWDGKNL